MFQRKNFTACACLLSGLLMSAAYAQDWSDDRDDGHIRHVLLISVDGMHAVDYLNCSKGISGVNNDALYCPNLAALGQTGMNYLDTTTSKPSDSFPGLMALVTGGSPRTVGAFYDVAYDRVLAPPMVTTGNGVAGGSCTTGQPNGTRTEYDEGIDINQMLVNGGLPAQASPMAASSPSIPLASSAIPTKAARLFTLGTLFGRTPSLESYTKPGATLGGPTSIHPIPRFPGLVMVRMWTITMLRISIRSWSLCRA